MDSAGDGPLDDPQALAEIDLYAELVIAASAASAPLSVDQIDDALGLPTVADRVAQGSA